MTHSSQLSPLKASRSSPSSGRIRVPGDKRSSPRALIGGALAGFLPGLPDITLESDLVLALFLSSPSTRTLPLLLWEQLNFQVTPEIAAAASVILAVTSLLILAATLLPRLGKDN